MTEPANDPYQSTVSLFPDDRIVRRPGNQPPLDPPGGPPHDSGMDDWQNAVDRQLGTLHGDVRDLLKGGIAGFVLLFTALVGGFLILLTQIDNRTDRLGAKIDAMTQTLGDKIDHLDARITGLDERTARLEGQAAKPTN